MCGRYTLTTGGQTLAAEFGIEEFASWEPRYNIAPSQAVAAIVRSGNGLRAAKLNWGLVPSWAKDKKFGSRAINARAETVREKPSFRAAFRRRRCLVLADGYYEWAKAGDHKQPYHIVPKAGGVFAFAGLWECWSADHDPPYYSCAIITCPANADLAGLHDRMPVILDRETRDHWMNPDADPASHAALLVPPPVGMFTAHRVSTFVNSPAHDDPRCIEPDSA